MELFLLYLWTIVGSVDLFFTLVASFTAGVWGVLALSLFFGLMDGAEDEPKFKTAYNFLKKYVWVPIIFSVIAILTPSQEDLAIIAGGWGVLELSKNEDVQEISSDTVELIKQKLNEKLKESEEN